MSESTNNISLSQAISEYSLNGNPDFLLKFVKENRFGTHKMQHMSLLIANMLKEKHPKMKAIVASHFLNGKIVENDSDYSAKMYVEASCDGNLEATYTLAQIFFGNSQYNLAHNYYEICVKNIDAFQDEAARNILDNYAATLYYEFKDVDKAAYYFQLAFEKFESPFAAKMLYFLHNDPNDTERYNRAKAFDYLLKAVSGGDMYACTVVAEKLLYGDEELSVSKDVELAYELLKDFDNVDDFNVNFTLGRIYLSLPTINEQKYNFIEYSEMGKSKLEKAWEQEKTPRIAIILSSVYSSIMRDHKKALEYLLFIERTGDTACYKDIAFQYSALGIYEKSLFYLEKVLESDIINDECLLYVFDFLSSPQYGINDIYKLCMLFDKYCKECEARNERKNIDVVYFVSKIILQSKTEYPFSKASAAIYLEAIIANNYSKDEATFLLAKYYQETLNFRKAENYYIKSFEYGYADAGAYLAHLYEIGGGSIMVNYSFALDWYTKAAETGSKLAAQEKDRFARVKKGLFKNRLVVERIAQTTYEY